MKKLALPHFSQKCIRPLRQKIRHHRYSRPTKIYTPFLFTKNIEIPIETTKNYIFVLAPSPTTPIFSLKAYSPLYSMQKVDPPPFTTEKSFFQCEKVLTLPKNLAWVPNKFWPFPNEFPGSIMGSKVSIGFGYILGCWAPKICLPTYIRNLWCEYFHPPHPHRGDV